MLILKAKTPFYHPVKRLVQVTPVVTVLDTIPLMKIDTYLLQQHCSCAVGNGTCFVCPDTTKLYVSAVTPRANALWEVDSI